MPVTQVTECRPQVRRLAFLFLLHQW